MIHRILAKSMLSNAKAGKVLVLLGARQVGKTTLISELSQGYSKVLKLNCDDYDDALLLEGKSSTELKVMLSPMHILAAASKS